jgi:hypothetical protein
MALQKKIEVERHRANIQNSIVVSFFKYYSLQ